MINDWWAATPMIERRATLRDADLWDGNTYAERTWEELPSHIQDDLQRAHQERISSGACL